MSKDASILEDGISRKFSPVNKVKVKTTPTVDSTWIPEDSIHTKTLHATKNGMYYAVSEEVDAYDTVIVNVSAEIGLDSKIEEGIESLDFDEIGEYGIDGVGGLNDLYDALTGLEDLDGIDMRDMENLLLENLEDTDAVIGKDPETGRTHEIRTDDEGNLQDDIQVPDDVESVVVPGEGITIPIGNASGHCEFTLDGKDHEYFVYAKTDAPYITGYIYTGLLGEDGLGVLIASDKPGSSVNFVIAHKVTKNGMSDETISETQSSTANNRYTRDGKSVYYTTSTWSIQNHDLIIDSTLIAGFNMTPDFGLYAWAMVYGNAATNSGNDSEDEEEDEV